MKACTRTDRSQCEQGTGTLCAISSLSCSTTLCCPSLCNRPRIKRLWCVQHGTGHEIHQMRHLRWSYPLAAPASPPAAAFRPLQPSCRAVQCCGGRRGIGRPRSPTPGVNSTIAHCSFGYATVKSSDSSQGADSYPITYLEPAHNVAACVLTSV